MNRGVNYTPVKGDRCYCADINAYFTYNGAKYLREQTDIVKVGDTAWTSTTTLSADPDLSFWIESVSTYKFRLSVLALATNTQKISVAIGYPTGSRADYARMGPQAAVWYNDVAQSAVNNLPGNFWGSSAGNNFFCLEYYGSLTTGVNAGTLQVSACQVVSSVSSSWILRGSSLSVVQTA